MHSHETLCGEGTFLVLSQATLLMFQLLDLVAQHIPMALAFWLQILGVAMGPLSE